MLFGNINKPHLIPYSHIAIQEWINEAISIASENKEGKYPLSDEGVFVILTNGETEPANQRKAEIHKYYIDIQILLYGEERIGYSNELDESFVAIDKLENDLLFIDNVKNENFVDLRVGDFALFFPDQIHRPMCAIHSPTHIKKAIIKVPAHFFC